MNKLMIVIRVLIIISFAFLTEHTELSAHSNPLAEAAYRSGSSYVSDQLIKSRLENLSSVIDINYTPEVGRRIREYTVNYRVAGERILGRVDVFFPLFEEEIYKRNLPDELKYIAIVESNLDPMAYSKAGAVGLWQFVKATGRMKGLKIDRYIDERKDPAKSTAAAMEYLSDLYAEFDDWTLGIAAYNCGPGNVRKAIRRAQKRDFWQIRRFLPNETQKYVPRIIAAMYLMQYYHAHELIPSSVNEDLRNTVAIKDGKRHNFAQLSKDLGVSYEIIRKINPQYKTSSFPENNENMILNIPASRFEVYMEKHDQDAYQRFLVERALKEQKRIEYERKKIIMETEIQRPTELSAIIYKHIRSARWTRKVYLSFNNAIS